MSLIHKARWILISVAFGFLAGSGYVAAQTAYQWFRGNIVDYLEVSAPFPTEAYPGDVVNVDVTYRKNGDCAGTWSYYVRWTGSPHYQRFGDGPIGAIGSGVYTLRHAIVLPIHTPAGPAVWREVISMSCGPWWSSVSRSAPVSFTVLPP